MKKIICSLFVLSIIAAFVSCKKESTVGSPDSPLRAAKFEITALKLKDIHKGEPVSVVGQIEASALVSESDSIMWSVSPSDKVNINVSGRKSAYLSFDAPGTYVVTAKFKAAAYSTTQTFTVVDFVNPPYYSKIPLGADEEVNLVLSRENNVDDPSQSILLVDGETKNKYDCMNHVLPYDIKITNDDVVIAFDSLLVPRAADCTPGQSTAKTLTAFRAYTPGVHKFTVKLKGTDYVGSFEKAADGTITFTWPYTKGVKLSPLVLN